MEVVVSTGAVGRAKLQSNHHHQQTNTQFFYRPDARTEGKISHPMDLLTTNSPGGLPTLSLTTNSSLLPWERFTMPLIIPLMPVPPSTLYDLENLIKSKSICMHTLQCSDTVGWATGRASSLKKTLLQQSPKVFLVGIGLMEGAAYCVALCLSVCPSVPLLFLFILQ